ncbi:hypothetical protein BDA99DRAFT_601061 [Phascolomyces articulosus]|uniref:Uncharacterized protein n=1 Tax=Phascolomyces articulosus TaxID=60185 RepID=A0AAD5PIU1_9FUNG|nr:hypothetical protein BDA99DRAFT_601061 [Phascolomyces articulosus]
MNSCRQHPSTTTTTHCMYHKPQQQPLRRQHAFPQQQQQQPSNTTHHQHNPHHHHHHYHHHHPHSHHHRHQQLPILINMDRRLAYVEALLDIMTNMVEIMWRGIYQDVGEQVLPISIRSFIREVLKRSHTTYTTAQIAICYLFQTQQSIRQSLIQLKNNNQHTASYQQKKSYVGCPKRMFLASLIVASKYVQDKTYRNSAWASIARMHVHQVNLAERTFLELCDYQLYMKQNVFDDLHRLLRDYVADALAEPPVNSLHHISFAWTPDMSASSITTNNNNNSMCRCSSSTTTSSTNTTSSSTTSSSSTSSSSSIPTTTTTTTNTILPPQQQMLMMLPFNNNNNSNASMISSSTSATTTTTSTTSAAATLTTPQPPFPLHHLHHLYPPQMTYARSGVKRPRAADNTPDFNQQQQYQQPNKRCKSQTPPCLLRPTRTQFVLGHAPCI